MQSQKIHNEKLNSGISSVAGSPRGAIKNLILKNEGAYKRQGHMPLVTLTDEELSPLKINGIFDFAYLDAEKSQACKIVHAKNRLFRLNEDFSNPLEIPLGNITIRDEKTKGFVNDGKLFIIGGGDILIYDGTKIYSAYKSEGAYIPTTTVGITDQYNGMQGEVKESYNLLTPRRKNTFIGSNARREKGTACKFLLDEKIKYGTKIILEVKIRTSVSESELDEATTSYIGIDKNGNEVSRIVTLRYERENISPDDTMLLIEPPRDEAGNEIKIKIGDKIHTYDTLPFGINISNQNELMLTFECGAPIVGKDNITLEYEADIDRGQLISRASVGACANGDSGAQVMLVSFGDNKIYYSDEKEGFLYLPQKNQITLGGGEKITAITRLWDNLFGAFKKNSFYRVLISGDKPQLHSSLDTIGAYSNFTSCLCDYDCLVLNERGIFGVDDYKSITNTQSSLLPRASDISELLNGYGESERENACATYLNGYLYLFVGEDAFVTKTSDKKGKSGSYEYSWCLWKDIGATYAYHSHGKLYFGNERGEIRTFYNGYSDIRTAEYGQAEGVLIDNTGAYTHLTLDKTELSSLEYAKLRVGKHKRLVSSSATFKNGEALLGSDLFLSDGSPKIFVGDRVGLEVSDEELEGLVSEVDLSKKSIKIDTGAGIFEGAVGKLYILIEGFDYVLNKENTGYTILYDSQRQKLTFEEEALEIRWEIPIECQYETDAIYIGKSTLTRLIFELSPKSKGEIELEIKTRKAIYKRKINIDGTLDFSQLDFSALSFEKDFEKRVAVPLFIRGADYIKIKISTRGDKEFSLGAISLCLKGEK